MLAVKKFSNGRIGRVGMENGVQRLVTVEDMMPGPKMSKERRMAKAHLKHFTGKLFRDAMVFEHCGFEEALMTVYLSGVWHGAELGPRVADPPAID